MPDAVQREEALRSALGRLPVAVFLVNERRLLVPLNSKATALIDTEGLRGDLVVARPTHPLSQLVIETLRTPEVLPGAGTTLTFPSGQRFVMEVSRRSEKGLAGWLILLIDEHRAHTAIDLTKRFDVWNLTARERETALLMSRGMSSDEISAAMEIAVTTVKTHVTQILDKSGSKTRAEFLAKLIHRS